MLRQLWHVNPTTAARSVIAADPDRPFGLDSDFVAHRARRME